MSGVSLCSAAASLGLAGLLAASGCSTREAPSSPTTPVLRGVFGRPLLNPQVSVTNGAVYVAWQVSKPGSVVRSELARINPRTGQIAAGRRLGAAFGQAIAAGGALWVTTITTNGEQVLRLNRDTLQLTRRWQVGSAGTAYSAGHGLAVAGGGLWVGGGNELLHLSLSDGRVLGSISMPGTATSDLSANADGTVLVTGVADSTGRGAVQRRDPATGAILASHPTIGVTAPVVAGPVRSAVWVAEPTGMMGYVQRLDAATLAPADSACTFRAGGGPCVEGTNGITAWLADGLLWVAQPGGGIARNYCAEPSGGRVLAPIRLPRPAQDAIVAATSRWIFYAAHGPAGNEYLRMRPSPPACRGP
jgi:hypothetical protein